MSYVFGGGTKPIPTHLLTVVASTIPDSFIVFAYLLHKEILLCFQVLKNVQIFSETAMIIGELAMIIGELAMIIGELAMIIGELAMIVDKIAIIVGNFFTVHSNPKKQGTPHVCLSMN